MVFEIIIIGELKKTPKQGPFTKIKHNFSLQSLG
jgi:hypothetical protein